MLGHKVHWQSDSGANVFCLPADMQSSASCQSVGRPRTQKADILQLWVPLVALGHAARHHDALAQGAPACQQAAHGRLSGVLDGAAVDDPQIGLLFSRILDQPGRAHDRMGFSLAQHWCSTGSADAARIQPPPQDSRWAFVTL